MSLTMATFDVEKLIADIAIRPAIWDRNFNSRQNKSFLEDTWDELAEMHKTPSMFKKIYLFFLLLLLLAQLVEKIKKNIRE